MGTDISSMFGGISNAGNSSYTLSDYASIKNGSYKKLMVIDDIYTTGSTLDCCALALKSAGVRAVYGLTACIVPGRE